jgi:transposase-like protein
MYYTDQMTGESITCPYCGWKDRNSHDCGLDSDGYFNNNFECGECGRHFSISMNLDVSYDSYVTKENIEYNKKIDEEEERDKNV